MKSVKVSQSDGYLFFQIEESVNESPFFLNEDVEFLDEDKEQVLECVFSEKNDNFTDIRTYKDKYLNVLSKNLNLELENQRLAHRIKCLEKKVEFFENCFKNLNEDQIKALAGKKVRNWSDESIQKGLAFRLRMGRSLYNDISKIAFLPSYNTLCRRIQHIEFDAGVSNDFCRYLKNKTENYQTIERHGCLIFDECAILPGNFIFINKYCR